MYTVTKYIRTATETPTKTCGVSGFGNPLSRYAMTYLNTPDIMKAPIASLPVGPAGIFIAIFYTGQIYFVRICTRPVAKHATPIQEKKPMPKAAPRSSKPNPPKNPALTIILSKSTISITRPLG